ncbi:ABC transporter substrate-binding protein [Actinospongicola halichondriae]|uniref:ABC transporter substrate-binding protein n=1 Tax=Actinospongicola halichondriae TaxID=3236844 RepID=UPI003D4699B9
MRTRGLAVLMATIALVAAACGGDRTEDAVDDPSTTTTPTDEPSGSDAGPGDFGTLTDVCGANEGGGALADADAADIQGITEDSIELGTVADPGFTGRQGLNQEIFDAATAFVEWCNAAGGINGKQLKLNLHDAALSNYQPVVEEACKTDFALVGAGAVQDNLWPTVGAACGLIDIAGFSVTPEKSGNVGDDPIARRSVQAIPNASDQVPIGALHLVADEFPDAGKRTGYVYSDFQTLVVTYERYRSAYEQAGNVTVDTQIYSIGGESNWQPFAIALRDADVQFLTFVGEGENFAKLQRAMKEIDFAPAVTLQETNFYDKEYLAAAGDAAEGTFIRTALTPFEEAEPGSATQQYLDNVEATGGKVAVLGAQSTSAWLLFATAAKECDVADNLTRTCVLETAAGIEDWEAGGLHAPTNPGQNAASSCVAVLRVQDGAFVRYAPDSGFRCDPDDIVSVEVPGA